MSYISFKGKKYDTETKKEVSTEIDVYIAGSKKNRKNINKQLQRLSKDPNLESLLEILRELLNEKEAQNLEDLIHNQNIFIPYYGSTPPRRIFSSSQDSESYLSTTERILEVDALGGGNGWRVLGAYDPNTDTIYVLSSLSARDKAFVLAHEKAHRRRHYAGESQSEYQVDMEAASKVGYNSFPNRHIGYRQAA